MVSLGRIHHPSFRLSLVRHRPGPATQCRRTGAGINQRMSVSSPSKCATVCCRHDQFSCPDPRESGETASRDDVRLVDGGSVLGGVLDDNAIGTVKNGQSPGWWDCFLIGSARIERDRHLGFTTFTLRRVLLAINSRHASHLLVMKEQNREPEPAAYPVRHHWFRKSQPSSPSVIHNNRLNPVRTPSS